MLTTVAPTLDQRNVRRDRLDLRQPRQCLDCAPDGFKLVMGANNIHAGRSVPGEPLTQLLADTGVRERAVKRVP